MAKTVKEAMKGKKDSMPLMSSIGNVLKGASKGKVKSVKLKIKMK
jgi:hypothetical protein